MQGWRISMEDAHAAILDLQVVRPDEKDFKPASVKDRLSFFGVYDGHGGDKVALFAGQKVHNIIAQQEAFKKGDIEQAMKDGFLATDRAILSGTRHVSPSRIGSGTNLSCQTPSMKKRCLGVLRRLELFPILRYTW